jgi:hypothetical protein
MELKLNVYAGKEIEKTYTTDTYDLMYGTIEDLTNAIDIEKFNSIDKIGNNELGGIVLKLLPQVKPLLKTIFDGITDEEIKRTKVKELIPVFVEAFKYAFNEIKGLGSGNTGN